jgi:hypothetical protein
MKPPDNRDSILARYKEGPALLERAIASLEDSDLDTTPTQGGWTIRQIIHHIVDGDDLWKTCIKIALGNEQAKFTLDWYRMLSQKEWGKRWAYVKRSIDISLTLLKANRDHILQLLEHVPDGWNRSIGFQNSDGTIERLPVGTVIEMQADHVEHHINRIYAIQKEINSA